MAKVTDEAQKVNLDKIGDNLTFSAKEAYNLLGTNISFSLVEKKGSGYVIGVTSPVPHEGKTYSTINLAYTLASDNKKVLLIDGDLRKPTIAKKLGVKTKDGLSKMLSANNSENYIQNSTIQKNLDILFSGPIPPNPANLIKSERFAELINNNSKIYDYIFVDLPPVNSVADAISLSTIVDGFVMVIKHNYTRNKDLFEAIRQLKFAKANILGVLYNCYSTDTHRYYKGYKYYHRNYYYDKDYKYESDNKEKDVKDGNK